MYNHFRGDFMRRMSDKLRQLHALKNRSILDDSLTKEYRIKHRGFIGECKLDQWLNDTPYIKYDDLYLTIDKDTIQLDTALFIGHHVIIIDAKNYKGHYKISDTSWTNEFVTIDNPILHISRTQSILSKVINPNYLHIWMVFVDDDFKPHRPIQLPHVYMPYEKYRLLFDLSQFNHRKDESLNIQKLMQNQVSGKHFDPPIRCDDFTIQPGLLCPHCKNDLSEKIKRRYKYVTCTHCNLKISAQNLVKFNIEDWIYIYQKGITLKEALNWCPTVSKDLIYNVLKKHFNSNALKRNSTYTLKE